MKFYSLSCSRAFGFALLLCIQPAAYARPMAIIFQLNDILITTDVVKAAGKVGPSAILHPFGLQRRFLEFLRYTGPQPNSAYMSNDPEGNPLSLAMYDWFKGSATNQEIHSRLRRSIDNDNGYLGWTERGAMRKIVDLTFQPSEFIDTRKLAKDAVAFVRDCKAGGNKVYVFANWDKESFQFLKAKFPELFSLFDGIVISGDTTMPVKAIKPDPSIYEYFVAKFNLAHKDCVLIDSQRENIATAEKLGWKTVLCVDDLKTAREALNRIS